jgi:hypothetical protein
VAGNRPIYITYMDSSTLQLVSTTTIRTRRATHARLKRLASETGQSMPDLLDALLERFEADRMLDAANAAFADLRNDPQTWRAELDERRAWEATLGDDLNS